MKLLLDIDIVLDVALRRKPWVGEAALLLSAIEEGRADGYVAAHTITSYHSIVAKQTGREAAVRATADLLRLVRVVPLGDADLQQALLLDLGDYEDAVQAVAALKVGADYLVTRNGEDFRGVAIPVRTAGELLPLL